MKRLLTAFAVATIAILSCKKKDHTPPPTAPIVTTAALTDVNLADSSVTAGGTIVSDGGGSITKAGIVWSKTNATPTTADSVVASTTTSGAFTVKVKGLTANNLYYYRAFATNSAGTAYGQVVIPGTVDTSKVKFTYNGQQVEYGVLISPTTGKKWLDRNLGAKRQATAFDDYQAYGDFFQWGRSADGHQLMNWTSSTTGTAVSGTTATVATSDNPNHNNFINPPYALPLDWRSDNNRGRWATTPQGPCPAGWHVPTKAEWAAEVKYTSSTALGTATSGGMTNRSDAYTQLKLTASGDRVIQSDGIHILAVGNSGWYWCSTDMIDPSLGGVSKGEFIEIAGGGLGYINASEYYKAQSLSVRCIKD
jgi:uncharacterized protein (TIGR02145 family)